MNLEKIIRIVMIKQSQSSFRYCYHLLGEEINFSSLRNEFSTVSPEGLGSILRFPCGEITEKWFRRNENSISSPKWIGEFRKAQWSNFMVSLFFIAKLKEEWVLSVRCQTPSSWFGAFLISSGFLYVLSIRFLILF